MWELVRKLRADGTTVILTTHYIEEAEEMADRVGVINKGEMILVEKKAELVQKMGKKRLILQVTDRLDAVPPALAAFNLTIGGEGHELNYDYDTRAARTGVATLLGSLSEAGVRIRDLRTDQSSLEEIFVGLVNEPKTDSKSAS